MRENTTWIGSKYPCQEGQRERKDPIMGLLLPWSKLEELTKITLNFFMFVVYGDDGSVEMMSMLKMMDILML